MLATGKSKEDKRDKRARGETSLSSRDIQAEWKAQQSSMSRLKRKCEIQDGIDKRRKTEWSERKSSVAGLSRSRPSCEVETREVAAKELQAEKRSLGQEKRASEQEISASKVPIATPGIAGSRTGGVPIVGPIRFPAGPLPWGKGSRCARQDQPAISPQGPMLGGEPPGLSRTSPAGEGESKRRKATGGESIASNYRKGMRRLEESDGFAVATRQSERK